MRTILLTCFVAAWFVRFAAAQPDLAAGFRNPPDSARPHTWWHWMNCNVTKEGITADLEAMKRVGLGGAQIFNVSEQIPEGPVKFMSAEWREMILHAAKEADRLGLELCLHNCAGWSSSGGPWIRPEVAMQMVTISETKVTGPAKFHELLPKPTTKIDYYRDIAVLAFPTPRDDQTRIKDIKVKAGWEWRYGLDPDLTEMPADATIKKSDIIDLTSKMTGRDRAGDLTGTPADGTLNWDVPAGDWTILRIGHTPTGKDNHPAPESGRGLEVDKLSREALDVHWGHAIAPLLKDLGPLAGKVLNNVLVDSYEVGHQNWTRDFREEFEKRRGYDILPWLVTLTGRVVESGEQSERFLWDFRRTIADLFRDNYYTYFAELCRKHGLLASVEPYDGPFHCVEIGRDYDIPMGEFWVGGGGERATCKLAASMAHTNGRKFVGAEAWTAAPERGRWQNHPYSMKALGDLVYSLGVNRMIFHRYAHQPWLDKFPGMTMGQWGTHFDRTNTWWEPGAAWIMYLSRCQYMLQEGQFVADVLYFAGGSAPNTAPFKPELKAAGYDYDVCDAGVLDRATAADGIILLPNGQGYRLLACPDSPFMTVDLLRTIRELAAQGAIVRCPPPKESPTLSIAGNDAEVRRRQESEWGKFSNTKLGAGRVFWDEPVEQILPKMGVKPDVEFSSTTGQPKMAWIHRTKDGWHWYFVSNQKPRSQEVACTFRISGLAPELWHPDTGEIEPAPVWSENDGRTTVRIQFDPASSVFVMFRKPAADVEHLASVLPPSFTSDQAGTGPSAVGAAGGPGASAQGAAWREPKIEIQKAVYEAVDGAGSADVTEKVREMVKQGETSIAATNGNFGDPTYMHVKRLRVEYTVDGKPLKREIEENGLLDLVDPTTGPAGLPEYKAAIRPDGTPELIAFNSGVYMIESPKPGRSRRLHVQVDSVPEPLELAGPWTLRFPPNWGAPASVTLDKLISWTEHSDAGVKYFSGTAEYEKEFDIPAGWFSGGSPATGGAGSRSADSASARPAGGSLAPDKALYLDLGNVKCLARVTLNGQDLGVWWKPPFAADISKVAKPGKNMLKVAVTNLWPNRIIGDEQFPDDCEWNGKPLKAWPKWLLDGTPRPVKERLTFTTWKHWTKDSPLLESGLLGPVTLRVARRAAVD